jgi:hypothetical protein
MVFIFDTIKEFLKELHNQRQVCQLYPSLRRLQATAWDVRLLNKNLFIQSYLLPLKTLSGNASGNIPHAKQTFKMST